MRSSKELDTWPSGGLGASLENKSHGRPEKGQHGVWLGNEAKAFLGEN